MGDEIKEMLQEILSSVRRIEARVSQNIGEPKADGTKNVAPDAALQKKKSIKEFLLELSPNDAVQVTLAIACYLETSESISPFNIDDLEKGFRAAKETIPRNLNDKVYISIKHGYMMEAEKKKDSKKAWVVTRTGEEYVKNKFKKTEAK